MNGPIVGLLGGAGLVLVLAALSQDGPSMPMRPKSRRIERLLRHAGIWHATPSTVVAGSCIAAVAAGVLGLALTSVPIVGVIAAIAGGVAPMLLLRRTAARRAEAIRAAWPDAVDALVSAVRAGMSLGEALASLAERGPLLLRPAFADFRANLRATGALGAALDELQASLADPIADRVIAAVRIAREAGGSDLGRVLRDCSVLLRQEARGRGEILARQSWTVSSARVAAAAPWITLVLLCTRAQAAAAYRSPQGLALIVVAAIATAVAYRVMRRIAHLPIEPRFLA